MENWKVGTKFLNAGEHTSGNRIQISTTEKKRLKPIKKCATKYDIVFNVSTNKYEMIEIKL